MLYILNNRHRLSYKVASPLPNFQTLLSVYPPAIVSYTCLFSIGRLERGKKFPFRIESVCDYYISIFFFTIIHWPKESSESQANRVEVKLNEVSQGRGKVIMMRRRNHQENNRYYNIRGEDRINAR